MGGRAGQQGSGVAGLISKVPASVTALVPESLKERVRPANSFPGELKSANWNYLQDLMTSTYNVKNLVNATPEEFEQAIKEFQALNDAAMEGYASAEGQRVKTVKFYWPYDHDFGTFKVGPGKDKYRPTRLLARFMDHFGIPPKDLSGKRILDIGCYLGGTSLLMAAMGAEVVAIEEVKKYVDCLTYIRDAFGVKNLEPRRLSLYELSADEYQDAFDIILFAGVLYHLSDPVLGLRLVFNAMKPGGTVLLETGAAKSDERILEYGGKNQASNKTGANWFFPSPLVVTEMMEEVGLTNVKTYVHDPVRRRHNRMIAVGTKVGQVDMLRAGLSVPNVR